MQAVLYAVLFMRHMKEQGFFLLHGNLVRLSNVCVFTGCCVIIVYSVLPSITHSDAPYVSLKNESQARAPFMTRSRMKVCINRPTYSGCV